MKHKCGSTNFTYMWHMTEVNSIDLLSIDTESVLPS